MNLRRQISSDLVVAPFVFNALSAKLAEDAGFTALYLGGGGIGFAKCVTEANLTALDFASTALEIRTVSRLPLIMDAAGGFGDPMHMVRTVGIAEAAGFEAIELEDAFIPKQAHHQVGGNTTVPPEFMVHKIREAAAARKTDLLIIARTGVGDAPLDDVLRRAESYRSAGADMLWITTHVPEDLRTVGERMPPPLMHVSGAGGIAEMQISRDELKTLGFRLLVDPLSPIVVLHKALKQCYLASAGNKADPSISGRSREEMADLMRTVDIERLLEIERRTGIGGH